MFFAAVIPGFTNSLWGLFLYYPPPPASCFDIGVIYVFFTLPLKLSGGQKPAGWGCAAASSDMGACGLASGQHSWCRVVGHMMVLIPGPV